MNTFNDFLAFTFSSFWHFIGILVLLFPVSMTISAILDTIAGIIVKPWSRFMRMLMVRKHGWPTNPNMDADGDIIEIKKEQPKTELKK